VQSQCNPCRTSAATAGVEGVGYRFLHFCITPSFCCVAGWGNEKTAEELLLIPLPSSLRRKKRNAERKSTM